METRKYSQVDKVNHRLANRLILHESPVYLCKKCLGFSLSLKIVNVKKVYSKLYIYIVPGPQSHISGVRYGSLEQLT